MQISLPPESLHTCERLWFYFRKQIFCWLFIIICMCCFVQFRLFNVWLWTFLRDVTVQGPLIVNKPRLLSLCIAPPLSLWQGRQVVSRCSIHYHSNVKQVVDPSRRLVSGPLGFRRMCANRLTSMETVTTAKVQVEEWRRVGRFPLLVSVCNSGRPSEPERLLLITKRYSEIKMTVIFFLFQCRILGATRSELEMNTCHDWTSNHESLRDWTSVRDWRVDTTKIS